MSPRGLRMKKALGGPGQKNPAMKTSSMIEGRGSNYLPVILASLARKPQYITSTDGSIPPAQI